MRRKIAKKLRRSLLRKGVVFGKEEYRRGNRILVHANYCGFWIMCDTGDVLGVYRDIAACVEWIDDMPNEVCRRRDGE